MDKKLKLQTERKIITREEFFSYLEEDRKRWEENQKRWEESQKKWEESQRENQKRWEENQKRWEENQKRWEENQKIIDRITRGIAKIGSRVGYKMEELVRVLIREFLEKNGIKPDTKSLKEFDQDGFVYGYPSDVEIDIFVSDPVIYGEVKSVLEDVSEVIFFNKKVEFFERKYGKAWKKFITCLDIKDRRREVILEAARKYGIEIIEA